MRHDEFYQAVIQFLRFPVLEIHVQSASEVEKLRSENEKLKAALARAEVIVARETSINLMYEEEKRRRKQ